MKSIPNVFHNITTFESLYNINDIYISLFGKKQNERIRNKENIFYFLRNRENGFHFNLNLAMSKLFFKWPKQSRRILYEEIREKYYSKVSSNNYFDRYELCRKISNKIPIKKLYIRINFSNNGYIELLQFNDSYDKLFYKTEQFPKNILFLIKKCKKCLKKTCKCHL